MGIHGVMVMVRERPSGTIERIHRQLVSSLKDGTREEKDRLTDQDLRPLGNPHVTVLNKAKNEDEVDVCLSEVMGVFDEMKEPEHHFGQKTGRAVGFELSVTFNHSLLPQAEKNAIDYRWEYIGGPWKPLKAYWFKGEEEHGENEAPRPPRM